ncbi:MAG: serine hydrolase [Candidatus Polarisedimenticolia bacterium]
MTKRFLSFALAVLLAAMPLSSALAGGIGEGSGDTMAPLQVADLDPVTGAMRLTYQTGCGAINNNIYIGSLDGMSSVNWTGSVCGIGTSGSYSGFNPGPGNYYFVVVGNDGVEEGSYGQSNVGGRPSERPPAGEAMCGLIQSVAPACTEPSQGQMCASSADCGSRMLCLDDAASGGQCACLDPFTGDHCESCAPGYTGPDCRQCAPGFIAKEITHHHGGGELTPVSIDVADPQGTHCEPDVPGDCTGKSCSARGSCMVVEREAVCACDEGYTGADCEDCAPNYERDATGNCELGTACRQDKCGGHGECVAALHGDVTCACDSGYSGADCGGPDLSIFVDAESFTLYDGESLILEPRGGRAPYTWRLDQGPAQLIACDGRPGCPLGASELKVVAPAGGFPDLELVKVSLNDGTGTQSSGNFAAIPSTFVPFTGPIKTELVPFYQGMLKYMRARGIRAAVLGISKGGQIVATNGYGYRDAGFDADPFVNANEGGPLVQPHSPFRIASVTKTLTAAAVRQAATDAGVNITSATVANRAATWVNDSIGFSLVSGVPPYNYNLNLSPPITTDQRWANVTINHLLNHHVGFWRDSGLVLPTNTGQPSYEAGNLPRTFDINDPSTFQPALIGTDSDISYATMYAVAALRPTDPSPNVRNMILFTAGNTFQYNPGGQNPTVNNTRDNYANIGYILAGRVLEGLKGETYDPDEPGVPVGWGKFPTLLQDYLCEASGIQGGIYPGDAFNPQPFEPYYRSMDTVGNENFSWNLAEGGDKIRFNAFTQKWEFCQSDCGGPGATWNMEANTPRAYGGVWLAQRNSAGGLVATTSALLKFARDHRVKVGTPFEVNGGIGSKLVSPGAYGGGSSHNGSLPGILSWLYQMGGDRINRVPTPTGAWNPDPTAPLDVDPNGLTIINEATVGKACSLPSDVAVAVMINQNQDPRAPAATAAGNSNNGNVYGRIIDIMADAACTVDAQGWPAMAEPQAVLFNPICN